MPRLLVPAFLLLAALPARGEVIKGYVAGDAASQTVYDRFATPSGFPNGPVAANTSAAFVGAGLDLSGIGWITGSASAITLISDGYVVGAAHVGLGSSVSFVGTGGVVVTRSVVSTTRLTTTYVDNLGQTRTLPSDVLVGKLSAPLTAAGDGVRRVGVASPATVNPGLSLLVHGQNGGYGPNNFYLGRNTLDAVTFNSFSLPDANGNPQNELTITAEFKAGTADGNGYLTGGDSGGPLLARTVPGSDLPALVGVHYGVSNANPGTYPINPDDISASSYVPAYIDQIDQVMLADGYRVFVVPVPEPAGLLAVAAVLLAVGRRARLACRPTGDRPGLG